MQLAEHSVRKENWPGSRCNEVPTKTGERLSASQASAIQLEDPARPGANCNCECIQVTMSYITSKCKRACHQFLPKSLRTGSRTKIWWSPLLPAPSRVGEWTERPISGKEVKFWICNILSQMPFFQVDGFTSHGFLKATTLAMLAKYGVSEADRLGHHSLKSKVLWKYTAGTYKRPR